LPFRSDKTARDRFFEIPLIEGRPLFWNPFNKGAAAFLKENFHFDIRATAFWNPFDRRATAFFGIPLI
jgi:hypothetical protein